MNFSDNVQFPKRFKPLPTGYRVIQVNSGHFLWVYDLNLLRNEEGSISVDRFWVRRCALAHAEENGRS